MEYAIKSSCGAWEIRGSMWQGGLRGRGGLWCVRSRVESSSEQVAEQSGDRYVHIGMLLSSKDSLLIAEGVG